MALAFLQLMEKQERLATRGKWSGVPQGQERAHLEACYSFGTEVEGEAEADTETGTAATAARRRKPAGARLEDSPAQEVSGAVVAVLAGAGAGRWEGGRAGSGSSVVRVRQSCLAVLPAAVVQTREPGRPSRMTTKAGLPHMFRARAAQLSWQYGSPYPPTWAPE